MDDSILLKNIITSIKDICRSNNFIRIKGIEIVVSENSHITEKTLKCNLLELCDEYIDKDTSILLFYGDPFEFTAHIDFIEGIEAEE